MFKTGDIALNRACMFKTGDIALNRHGCLRLETLL